MTTMAQLSVSRKLDGLLSIDGDGLNECKGPEEASGESVKGDALPLMVTGDDAMAGHLSYLERYHYEREIFSTPTGNGSQTEPRQGHIYVNMPLEMGSFLVKNENSGIS